MSVFDSLEKLNTIDFSSLSLEERRKGENEVRLAIFKISESSSKDVSSLSKKIALLKVWQKFNQLNLNDDLNRKFARVKSITTTKKKYITNLSELQEQNDEFAGDQPNIDPPKNDESVTILIKEDVEVEGLAFEHGSVVDVPANSADKLIATEKTEKVENKI